MCSVGDAFNIDITEDIGYCEYICKDCGKIFKGIGKNLTCPNCKSVNIKIKE
jgi:rubrerythrin